MELTPSRCQLLINAWALAAEGKGMVLRDECYPDADQLAEAGWLERRFEPDGELSWWWTPAAETALNVSNLTTPPAGANLN